MFPGVCVDFSTRHQPVWSFRTSDTMPSHGGGSDLLCRRVLPFNSLLCTVPVLRQRLNVLAHNEHLGQGVDPLYLLLVPVGGVSVRVHRSRFKGEVALMD